jgi:hypothetical protein
VTQYEDRPNDLERNMIICMLIPRVIPFPTLILSLYASLFSPLHWEDRGLELFHGITIKTWHDNILLHYCNVDRGGQECRTTCAEQGCNVDTPTSCHVFFFLWSLYTVSPFFPRFVTLKVIQNGRRHDKWKGRHATRLNGSEKT